MWQLVIVIAVLILMVLDAVRRPKRHGFRGRTPRGVFKRLAATTTSMPAVSLKAGGVMGIDACKDGWAIATCDSASETITFAVVNDIRAALDPAAASGAFVAIDIPIGLPRSGSRACDRAAHQILGPQQGSRVFPAPSRAALAGTSYTECCALNSQASEKRISKQTYAIIPKINEVDRWMSADKQARVREVHPEVSFCVVGGAPLLYSKKTIEGQHERLAILLRHGIAFDPVEERRRLRPSRVAVDDLVDAAVALLTAWRMSTEKAQVLGDGALDARGLRMEIVA